MKIKLNGNKLAALSLTLTLGLALSATPASADALADAQAADIAMSNAVLARDKAAFKALLTEEAVFLSVPKLGPDAVAEAWSAFFLEKRQALLQWAPDQGKAAASGDVAYTSGPYDLERTGPDGKVAHLKGRYMTIWVKGEKGWQVWSDGSAIEPGSGSLSTHLAELWPAAAPAAPIILRRQPIRSLKSKAGDLLVVVGDLEIEAGGQKARGRYATVSESDGKGGWRLIAEAGSPPAPSP